MHKNRNKQLIDLTGLRFNRWTVIEYSGFKNNSVHWLCVCDCGNKKEVTSLSLRTNQSRSCGCYKSEVTAKRNRSKPVYQLPSGEAATNKIMNGYKQSEKKRNILFGLTKEQFRDLIFKACDYCGIPPSTATRNRRYNGQILYNGIDRVDNSKGYTVENCVTCCETCNRAKLKMGQQEFFDWVKRIAEHLHKTDRIKLNP